MQTKFVAVQQSKFKMRVIHYIHEQKEKNTLLCQDTQSRAWKIQISNMIEKFQNMG